MTSERLMCLIVLVLTFSKGNYLLDLNSTKVEETTSAVNGTLREEETSLSRRSNSSGDGESIDKGRTILREQTGMLSESNATRANSTVGSEREIIEIFRGVSKVSNGTNRTDEIAVNSTDCVNVRCVKQSWNDTAKTNYTLMAEAVGALNSEESPFRLEKSAAIAAGVFLVSAILGYLSCVGYRRFLQRKYGNSQILTAEEVYDTTDLRYFEI